MFRLATTSLSFVTALTPADSLGSQETPLVDSINRKLEEINFDCRLMASAEDGSLVGLPPPAPKGAQQILRPENASVVTSIIDHLHMAENGELAGGGKGTVARAAFVYRAWDGTLFPSQLYRFEHFVDALETMATVGVNGELFYLGYGQTVAATNGTQNVTEIEDGRLRRKVQMEDEDNVALGATEVLETSLVYGLVNVAAYLAQAMTDSIIHDACDELNIDYLDDDITDGRGLDDGKDVFRFPISNACGQHGRSYEDESCDTVDIQYDCKSQMDVELLANMESYGISRGHWVGAPGSFYCGPKEVYGKTGKLDLLIVFFIQSDSNPHLLRLDSGFWDAMTGREADDVTPTPNDGGRTGMYHL
jgi:hypothetical protein